MAPLIRFFSRLERDDLARNGGVRLMSSGPEKNREPMVTGFVLRSIRSSFLGPGGPDPRSAPLDTDLLPD
ncbi:hypothetical protein MOK15_07430 [Sphingobium sp. BYY-5]|uniref:hypothetical protein n=1 Tax=Sphingobium sp. BYY-5 TaxID=2926400 RepID=UPI001FA7B074|nr:hypothetical protein [Sphingobium sp. BYY-5]MCI4589921.1 hypothetical protein [Sphingobium sp. BYY-5]